MPGTPTTRLGLPGPVGPDPAWVPGDVDLLRNRIDLVVPKYGQGAYASKGSASTQGNFYYSNDLGPNGTMLYADGTAWRANTPVVLPQIDMPTSITLGLGHAGCCLMGSAAAGSLNVTVPNDTSVGFPYTPDMTVIQFHQVGVVQITFVAGSGVTINVESGHLLKTRGQYAWAGLIKRAANTWSLMGSLA